MLFKNGRILLENGLLENACVRVEKGRIAEIGHALSEDGETVDLHGHILAPGFVDIHCHGGGNSWCFDAPAEAALWHLRAGTTSLLCSLWRNAGDYSYERAIRNIRGAAATVKNIRGIHMEGPYIDPDYGSEGGRSYPIDPAEYSRLTELADGFIRTWTFDPAQPGAADFAKYMHERGIVLGVCYSRATPELLYSFLPLGLRLANHVLCGSGAPKSQFAGTKEPGSDEFTVICDDMFAELIADSLGAHVRPFYLNYYYRLKGADRVILVSDCCAGGDTHGSDINVIAGELYGSRLSLSVAVRNMRRHTGASITELSRMASLTPARAVGLDGEVGSIAVGKHADLIVWDDKLNVLGVYLAGEKIK